MKDVAIFSLSPALMAMNRGSVKTEEGGGLRILKSVSLDSVVKVQPIRHGSWTI